MGDQIKVRGGAGKRWAWGPFLTGSFVTTLGVIVFGSAAWSVGGWWSVPLWLLTAVTALLGYAGSIAAGKDGARCPL